MPHKLLTGCDQRRDGDGHTRGQHEFCVQSGGDHVADHLRRLRRELLRGNPVVHLCICGVHIFGISPSGRNAEYTHSHLRRVIRQD